MAITIPISVAGPYLPYLGFITVFHNPFRSPSTFSQHLRRSWFFTWRRDPNTLERSGLTELTDWFLPGLNCCSFPLTLISRLVSCV